MVERPQRPHLLLDELTQGDENDFVIGRLHDGVEFTQMDLTGEGLHDRELVECLITHSKFDEAVLNGSRLRETRLAQCEAIALKAAETNLREVEFEACRFGAFEMYDAQLRRVLFKDCRLGYLNLRGAELLDVTFENCHLDDLDLGGATCTRLALPGTSIGNLMVTGITCKDVDLRGATLTEIHGPEHLRGVTISPEQLMDLAPLLAKQFGIDVG